MFFGGRWRRLVLGLDGGGRGGTRRLGRVLELDGVRWRLQLSGRWGLRGCLLNDGLHLASERLDGLTAIRGWCGDVGA